MVNLAFLVVAHSDVNELLRLCQKLRYYGDAFIHVDIKANVEYMDKLHSGVSKLSGKYNTYILDDRVYVTWGGYSQLYAQEKLLEAALTNDSLYDRFFYISGLDYPLCSPNKLQLFCTENADKEYIRVYNITKGNDNYLSPKIKYYHYFRDIHLPHKSFLRRAIIGGSKLFLKAIGVKRNPFFYVKDEKWDVYQGSQWVGLTRSCAVYVLNQLRTNKEMVNFFKTTYAPDEMVVPTIIMNSSFAREEYNLNKYNFSELAYLHYLQYGNGMCILDENDFEKLMASGKLFARKFTSNKSKGLIKLINQRHKGLPSS